MSTLVHEKPDPEDSGTHNLATYLILRACEFAMAGIYATMLPWWRPAIWLMIVACTGTLRHWQANRLQRLRQPPIRRKSAYRTWTWIHMAAVGSIACFAYVPDNLLMLTLLGVHLFAAAMVAGLRLSGDFVRYAVAVALIIAPSSLRATMDGALRGDLTYFLMGMGGFLTIGAVILVSRFHEQMLDHQFEQRTRAERAADAVASVSLSKSRFFAAVSHDLRQPVHAIGLYLEPLAKLSASNPDAGRAIEGLRLCWRALDGLLSQVLDLTRLDAGVLQPTMQSVDLARLIRRQIQQHSVAAERVGIRMVALVREGLYAAADDLMLRRVLSNLLDNALKYSRPGSTVAVVVRPSGDMWRLQVRDAGVGIPASSHAKIFEEFVQIGNDARDRQRGYGLGLAISRRFVQLMEGSITVRSAPGRGTCMTVGLRRCEAPDELLPTRPAALQSATTRQAASSPDDSGIRLTPPGVLPPREVLLVEDDLLVATAMRQLLQSWGQRVVHVETAAEARVHMSFCDVAICDVRLPGGESGIEVAEELRRRGKKVLLLTGETDPGIRRQAADKALPLLIKPISSARLMKAMQDLFLSRSSETPAT